MERRGFLSVRWATLQLSAGRIARVEDADTFSKGMFLEYTLPPSTAGPEAIPGDPEGRAFAHVDGTAGRMTPAGDLVEYPLPAIGSSPAWVAAMFRSRNLLPCAAAGPDDQLDT